jgi:hypothetical protein
LNANGEPLDHAAYILDYEATFPVKGGASLQLVASDSNCSAIKNCAAPVNESVCDALVIDSVTSDHPEITQPYEGQYIVLDVQSVTAQ